MQPMIPSPLTIVQVIHFGGFTFRHKYFRVDCHSISENVDICKNISFKCEVKNNSDYRWTGPGDKEGGDTGTDVRVSGNTLPVTRLFKVEPAFYYYNKESIRKIIFSNIFFTQKNPQDVNSLLHLI